MAPFMDGFIPESALISALSMSQMQRRLLAALVGVVTRLNWAFIAAPSSVAFAEKIPPLAFNLYSSLGARNRLGGILERGLRKRKIK